MMPFPSVLRSTLTAAVLVAVSIASAQTPDFAEDKLIEVLTSDASDVDKSNACRFLRIKGTEKSVPALAALLIDENLSHAARIALEPMPYPEAGEALRAALEKTDGITRVGIITTLGNRRDEEAVPLLAPLLESDDTATRDAALLALGKIATREADTAIYLASLSAADDAREKFDQALLLMAQARGQRGERTEAKALYRELMGQKPLWRELMGKEVDPVVQTAAIAGVIELMDPDAHAVFVAALKLDDPDYRHAAAGQLNSLPPDAVTTIAAKLAQFPPDSQVALLAAIRIRRVEQALPHVLEAAKSDIPEVQIAALRALGQMGDNSALPLLIEHAFGDEPTATTAGEALTRLHAPGVDDELTKNLTVEKDPARRARWLGLIVARNSPGIVELLLAEATHTSPEVRQPAMAALAGVGSPSHLPAMTRAVLAAERGAERDEAEKAVMLVSQQVADPDKRATAALAVYREANSAEQLALLPLLGRLGGEEARQTVRAILNSHDADEVQRDAAVRALANWPDASVADNLRELAQHSKVPRYRQQALRALIRVVSLPGSMPDEQKLAELKQAIELAERDDERRLALQRLASVRTIESLRLLVPYLDNAELAQVAGQSITELARHGHVRDPHKGEFIAALERVIAAETTDERTRAQATRHLQAARQ